MEPRSKSSGVGFESDSSDYYINDVFQNTVTGYVKYNFKESNGWNIPDYHKRKERGELLPFTPWNQWEVSTSQSVPEDHVIYNGIEHLRDGNFALPPEYWWIDIQDLKDLADGLETDYWVQAAAAKIYSSGWDALTFMAELGKTIAMFRGLVQRLVQYILDGHLDKLWLEGRYGWRLIYFDIKDVEEAIRNLDESRTRFKESAGHTEEYTEVSSLDDLGYGSRSFDFQRTRQFEIGTRGSIVADISPPKVAFNPVTTGWEVIPWSFVLDWCINIGQYLEAMSFLAYSSKHTAAGGIHITCEQTVNLVSQTWNPGFSGRGMTFSSSGLAKYTVRTPTSVSFSPFTKLRLEAFKVTDLIALLAGALRGKYAKKLRSKGYLL